MGIWRGYVFKYQLLPCFLTHCLIKANVLINQHGNACLADFGLLTITLDPTYPISSSSSMKGGTAQWMSPELINPEGFGLTSSWPTKESDRYALGMVVYEVLSGQVPFAPSKDFIVMWKVVEGEHPVRPEGVRGAWFTDDLWGMLKLCWAPQPSSHPSIWAVLDCLKQVSRAWKPPSLQIDAA